MDGNAWSLPHNEFNIRYDDERIAAAGLDVADYTGMLSTMLSDRGCRRFTITATARSCSIG